MRYLLTLIQSNRLLAFIQEFVRSNILLVFFHNHKFNLFLLNFTGLFIMTWYILARFILPRLPRVIPYDLSLTRLVVLLGICIVFIWLLVKIFYPREPNEVTRLLLRKIQTIFKPAYILDIPLRNNETFKRFIILTSPILSYLCLTTYSSLILHMLTSILPRFILLCLLFVDVFYYGCIQSFYSYAFLGLIPLIIRCYIYNIRKLQEEYTVYLDSLYFVKYPYRVDKGKTVDVRRYINDVTFDTVYEHEVICDMTWVLMDKHNKENPDMQLYYRDLTPEQRKLLSKEFYCLTPALISMSKFLYRHTSILDWYGNPEPAVFKDPINGPYLRKFLKRPYMLYIRWAAVILIGGYLTCWGYILLVSLPTFHLLNFEIVFLESFQDIMNPFSDDILK